MTETQFYILITVIGSGLGLVGAAIRWSAGRVVTSMDRNTTAMIENTRSNTVLAVKIDGISDYVQRATPPEAKRRGRTAPHGIAIVVDEEPEK